MANLIRIEVLVGNTPSISSHIVYINTAHMVSLEKKTQEMGVMGDPIRSHTTYMVNMIDDHFYISEKDFIRIVKGGR